MPHPWDNQPSPDQARVDWHRVAAARDGAYLAQGPADDTEITDPYPPDKCWRPYDCTCRHGCDIP